MFDPWHLFSIVNALRSDNRSFNTIRTCRLNAAARLMGGMPKVDNISDFIRDSICATVSSGWLRLTRDLSALWSTLGLKLTPCHLPRKVALLFRACALQRPNTEALPLFAHQFGTVLRRPWTWNSLRPSSSEAVWERFWLQWRYSNYFITLNYVKPIIFS